MHQHFYDKHVTMHKIMQASTLEFRSADWDSNSGSISSSNTGKICRHSGLKRHRKSAVNIFQLDVGWRRDHHNHHRKACLCRNRVAIAIFIFSGVPFSLKCFSVHNTHQYASWLLPSKNEMAIWISKQQIENESANVTMHKIMQATTLEFRNASTVLLNFSVKNKHSTKGTGLF